VVWLVEGKRLFHRKRLWPAKACASSQRTRIGVLDQSRMSGGSLGFSFAMSVRRYDARRSLVVE
jgi:hypothetical protein